MIKTQKLLKLLEVGRVQFLTALTFSGSILTCPGATWKPRKLMEADWKRHFSTFTVCSLKVARTLAQRNPVMYRILLSVRQVRAGREHCEHWGRNTQHSLYPSKGSWSGKPSSGVGVGSRPGEETGFDGFGSGRKSWEPGPLTAAATLRIWEVRRWAAAEGSKQLRTCLRV